MTPPFSASGSTVVLTGFPVEDGETGTNLPDRACSYLNKASGISVKPDDLQAIHRNAPINKATDSATDSASDSGDKKPPSITIRLNNFNQKDLILSNFGKKKKHDDGIKLVQSLCPFYQDLRRKISLYCKEQKIPVRYIHYRSATSGLVLKTNPMGRDKKVHLITKMFKFSDFMSKVPSLS